MIRFTLLLRPLACLLMAAAMQTHAADALPFHGWTLTHNDMAYNLSVLDRMRDYGVTHVQLSHNIVTRIDQFEDPEVVDRVTTLADRIHAQGGQAIVWAQELSFDTVGFCFDLDGDDMQARMQAYRDALTRVPAIDGIMVSFGSAPTELAATVPTCQPARFASIKERYKAMIEAVARVATDEFGKQVYVRTFYHKSYEIPYLRQAVEETTRPVVVMSKSEPNDFEPYYPLNPLVGDVGAHDQFLELDCAGEYWGRGAIPFVAVEYFAQRYRESLDRSAGAESRFIGSTCRVDRYEYSAFGTLNEANIAAQALLARNPDQDWQTLLGRFIESQFGLARGTQAHAQLFDILRRTYWVGRKMYYAKGDWAFKKGSDLPSSNADALGQLLNKTIMQWDLAYTPITLQLMTPSRQTVLELLQEKREAMELAARNLAALPALRGALKGQQYAELDTALTKQQVATAVWFNMAGALFGGRNLSPEASSWVTWHLDELERLADTLDNQGFPQIVDPYPFPSADIREFVDNTRASLLLPTSPQQPQWAGIEGIDLVGTDLHSAEITWTARAGVRYTVELSQRLPDYPVTYTDAADSAADGPVRYSIPDLEPQTPYWFRIRAEDGDATMVSGDYTFWTRSAATDTGGDTPGDDPIPDPAGASGGGGIGAAQLLIMLLLLAGRTACRPYRRT
ncbi:MAG: hypothetical protein PHP86_14470 [Nevskiales bacterium]|nr:hypothetical protein [Nevskiales bacterium]